MPQAGTPAPRPSRPTSSARALSPGQHHDPPHPQSDVTHWPLADGTDTEIIDFLDNHSRYLLHLTAHPRVTGGTVVEAFLDTAGTYGLPASTLTDNGMVYTTRLSGGRGGRTGGPLALFRRLAVFSSVPAPARAADPLRTLRCAASPTSLRCRVLCDVARSVALLTAGYPVGQILGP